MNSLLQNIIMVLLPSLFAMGCSQPPTDARILWVKQHKGFVGIDHDRADKPIVWLSFPARSDLTDDDLKLVAGMTELQKLDLSERITDAGIARLKPLRKLEVLHLEETQVTDEGLGVLESFDRLESLTLGGPKITDAGLAHLKSLQRLEDLSLIETNITDAGLSSLENLNKLRSLDLGATRVGDAGLVHLKGLKNLSDLHLGGTNVTDAGLAALVDLRLAQLDLQDTVITDKAVQYLKRIKNLAELNLTNTDLSEEGVAELRQALRVCKIEFKKKTVSNPGKEESDGKAKRP